ncbi:DsbA family protein [Saccharopolyspora indica]|uniref:DsbA family protein n=1 Tax=Saccharopolyspora indica TaxID=1229659 RepID=UPI0022EA2F90|nr:DsbA family protein [Saccharopolyspora indica]MDA3644141.1 DsbA family protein [Saccharopolyspora indica]
MASPLTASTTTDHHVRLWFDPVCPWCWVTYQWLREVRANHALRIDLSLMSLAFLNEGRPEVPDKYKAPTARSLQIVRVIAAAESTAGSGVLEPMYDSLGKYLHVDRGRDFELANRMALSAAGLETTLAHAAGTTEHDDLLRSATRTSVSSVGPDVGTPIVEFNGTALFGPILSRIPRGQKAVDLFESLTTIASYPHFFELKRQRTEDPHLGESRDGAAG